MLKLLAVRRYNMVDTTGIGLASVMLTHGHYATALVAIIIVSMISVTIERFSATR